MPAAQFQVPPSRVTSANRQHMKNDRQKRPIVKTTVAMTPLHLRGILHP